MCMHTLSQNAGNALGIRWSYAKHALAKVAIRQLHVIRYSIVRHIMPRCLYTLQGPVAPRRRKFKCYILNAGRIDARGRLHQGGVNLSRTF